MKIAEREGPRDGEIFHWLIHSQVIPVARMSQAEARSQAPSLGFPCAYRSLSIQISATTSLGLMAGRWSVVEWGHEVEPTKDAAVAATASLTMPQCKNNFSLLKLLFFLLDC